MPYVFNPFTGNFDVVDTNTAAGSDTEVQFNDNGSLNGDTGLTFNKTTNALTVGASTVDGGSAKIYGDIDLDDGGSFSTTVQAVTPTANRTISFPDATGTVALVNGANGTIQYNDAGTLKGNSDFTVDPDWNDASTVFTGLKLNVTDTASAAGSNLLDLQSGGTSQAVITGAGNLILGNNGVGKSIVASRISYPLGAIDLIHAGGVDEVRIQVATAGKDPALAFYGSSSTQRVFITSPAANELEIRRGTNAQTFRLYNTYTDASNFERTSITRDSSGLVIDAQKGGTGADPTNLLDVKLDGASKATVSSGGVITGSELRYGGVRFYSSGQNYIQVENSVVIRLGASDIQYAVPIGFTGTIGTANDVFILRDTANTLAQRNGTASQTFRLYNTYTDASNYERLSFNWDTNVFKIKSEAGGTGTVRGIQLGSAATEPVALFGATPVVQPTTAVGSATVAGGGGTAVDDATTFNGYTLAQVVQALQNLGILA